MHGAAVERRQLHLAAVAIAADRIVGKAAFAIGRREQVEPQFDGAAVGAEASGAANAVAAVAGGDDAGAAAIAIGVDVAAAVERHAAAGALRQNVDVAAGAQAAVAGAERITALALGRSEQSAVDHHIGAVAGVDVDPAALAIAAVAGKCFAALAIGRGVQIAQDSHIPGRRSGGLDECVAAGAEAAAGALAASARRCQGHRTARLDRAGIGVKEGVAARSRSAKGASAAGADRGEAGALRQVDQTAAEGISAGSAAFAAAAGAGTAGTKFRVAAAAIGRGSDEAIERDRAHVGADFEQAAGAGAASARVQGNATLAVDRARHRAIDDQRAAGQRRIGPENVIIAALSAPAIAAFAVTAGAIRLHRQIAIQGRRRLVAEKDLEIAADTNATILAAAEAAEAVAGDEGRAVDGEGRPDAGLRRVPDGAAGAVAGEPVAEAFDEGAVGAIAADVDGDVAVVDHRRAVIDRVILRKATGAVAAVDAEADRRSADADGIDRQVAVEGDITARISGDFDDAGGGVAAVDPRRLAAAAHCVGGQVDGVTGVRGADGDGAAAAGADQDVRGGDAVAAAEAALAVGRNEQVAVDIDGAVGGFGREPDFTE